MFFERILKLFTNQRCANFQACRETTTSDWNALVTTLSLDHKYKISWTLTIWCVKGSIWYFVCLFTVKLVASSGLLLSGVLSVFPAYQALFVDLIHSLLFYYLSFLLVFFFFGISLPNSNKSSCFYVFWENFECLVNM